MIRSAAKDSDAQRTISTDAFTSGAVLPTDYFRIRDFEYVQPLYDLSFLLEVDALAKGTDNPKYRTFSLWRAGYSLDGYGTTIDRWLDGTISDEGLDYVPSGRMREYLMEIRRTGSVPELRGFKGKRYERCLRLRSVRGLGPSQIAQTLTERSLSDDWFEKMSRNLGLELGRLTKLCAGTNEGPWQTAHIVPPLLRLLEAIGTEIGEPLKWDVPDLNPFQPLNCPVAVGTGVDRCLLINVLKKTLRRQQQFSRSGELGAQDIELKHQMGWSFVIHQSRDGDSFRSVPELARTLDPLATTSGMTLLADLHLHTAWSDGSASVNGMAKAIAASGLKYFAVTDHSRSCKLQGGLTPVLWLRQANALSLASPVCPVLHGIEVDILKDGTLDLPLSLLAAGDLVVASVHSSWSDSARENTDRLLHAIESGCIDIIAHPTSAVIGKPGVPDYLREPAEVYWDEVFERCARWRVALELNCFPSRLDLPIPLLEQAIAAGCAISLGSDAHARSHLLNLRLGEAALKRLKARVVLNRFSYDKFKQWISESRAIRKSLAKSTAAYQQPEFQFESKAKSGGPRLTARIQSPQRIPNGSRVVGIDLTAGDKATGMAVLNGMAVETCSLITNEEILTYVREHKPKIVSIDSPLGLPGGGDTVDPRAGIMRVAEHDLASVGIPAYPSLIDSMEKLTLRGILLRRAIEGFPKAPRVIESYPGAAQDILCIPRKQKSLGLLREGLRRLGLEGPGLDTRSHDEMDAITSAIVGRYHESGLFEPMGIPSEAQLIVPKVSPLAFEQNPVLCLAGKTGAGKSVIARYLSVFYGFTWVRTRNVIRGLLIEDSEKPVGERLFNRKVDPAAITENDLREFGALILDVYKQEPLRKHLMKTVKRCTTPVVVDSIRDVVDVERNGIRGRPVMIWFVDCPDSIIRNRLMGTKKMGEKRASVGSPVDRTAPAIRNEADQVISNSGTLEELRWRVDDALFEVIQFAR